jgi:ParB/Sulfiredoxin domain
MAKKLLSTGPSISKATPIEVDELYLDPRNPRLAGKELSIDDQEAILGLLWQERAVNELVDSIASSGYWQHEVLFATREDGKLVVIEGNRRLAAVKLLLSDRLRGKVKAIGIPSISPEAKKRLVYLPVIECSREELWEYIGFKHVNGPQDWDSIAKAEYIARVHNEYGVALEKIARTIGDKHQTVKRLYHGLMVLEQAEHQRVFDREDRWGTRFAYSHLWTGLGYSGIQAFLGLTDQRKLKPDPVPARRLGELGEFCRWLYGSKNENRRPIIRSQNPDLRYLDEVLRSKTGIAALRAGLPLETSRKASQGDERLLREALVMAEQRLREAVGLVVTGYYGEADLLKSAEDIVLLAQSIQDEMEKTSNSRRRKTSRLHTR